MVGVDRSRVMHRRRVRRWATRAVLAAVFGAAALGAYQAGLNRIMSDVIWVQDVIWVVPPGGSGGGP
jgi:hypothetical protein